MSQDNAYYRNFCMRSPRPALVRVYAGEDVHDLRVDAEQNWARLGETIAALDPDKLELYSESDDLLRADKRKVSRGDQSVRIPDALHKDPETARLTHFADLLHRAYQHSTEIAFSRLSDFVSMQNEREQMLAKRLERLESKYFDALRENTELAAGAQEAENPLVDAFLHGMNGASAKSE
jgi:hypothetical protein